MDSHHIWVCSNDKLKDQAYIRLNVNYAGKPATVIVIKHQGKYIAYKNLCVHMPRELDCEQKTVFDQTGKHLRCSMHGIVYDPDSGESLSTMCSGRKLTPVRLIEYEGSIWIKDKRVRIANENRN